MIKTNPSARAAILLALTVLFLASGAHGQSLPYAWGWGFHGEMGNNTTSYAYPVPVAVNVSGVLNGKSIAAMAAGNSHSMALCSDGTLAAWGAGNQGQIGTGQVGNNTTPPTLVPVLVNTSASSALFGKTVTAISAGGQFSLALCSDGTVAAWGWNFQGELGDASTVQRDLPVAVQKTGTALAGKTVVAISAGDLHCIALCSDGTLVAWGSG
ncbi:MAG: cell surface receptor domain protein, partial [Verrucomicrobiales bacterium]|nr:cell surface receptor domain protein [Verrucomicrobiales bacterium]